MIYPKIVEAMIIVKEKQQNIHYKKGNSKTCQNNHINWYSQIIKETREN